MKTYRVAQYATGVVGTACLKGVIRHQGRIEEFLPETEVSTAVVLSNLAPETAARIEGEFDVELRGVEVPALSGYYRSQPRRNGLLVGYAGVPDRVLEPRRVPLVPHPVEVVELVVLLVPDPGVDEHERFRCLDQKAAQRQRDPVPVVRRDAALPERLRHDTEHGAPVEPLVARVDGVDPDRCPFLSTSQDADEDPGEVLGLG